MRISQVHAEQVIARLPSLQSFTALDAFRPGFVYVTALGFEERCLNVPEQLATSDAKGSLALYLRYPTNIPDNDSNRPRLLAALDQSFERILVDDVDADALSAVLSGAVQQSEDVQLVLDLSVMSSYLVMRLVHIALSLDVELVITYSEAEEYYPTESEYCAQPEHWQAQSSLGLDEGCSQVTVSREHQGFQIENLPDSVFVFPSFNAQRTMALISEVDPSLPQAIDLGADTSQIVWFLGRPHLDKDQWRVNAMRDVNAIPDEAHVRWVSTFDYRESLGELEAAYSGRSTDARITVGPMGSKLQCLGAALFCYMHPDVRAMFSPPARYNAAHYSRGTRDTWRMSLGDTSKLRTELDSIGALIVEHK